ncbi:NAD-dependent succinate-semialdehyde dehydrogenase [Olleya aquimaris]|uniref:NAD-dependent succinate-semialdehyde dehydrogenase n=1 Tax=Olleya sediminilitoris TaxID=2795739 RepID=A0ABS1WPF6_9FLAO|nr:NAD-dependent succinate-semialdehyde dehydrogenase [Olleya sediminilitoris]AXO79926.1 NAD-dependent succinate-semialdehyde dehydrogenase [Olleya aquimaris]MBL7561003.1 NAD-dependent succinate-semialdehyde dehydrogenase [Olleya sediminilitoris]
MKKQVETYNPYTGEKLKSYNFNSNSEVNSKLETANQTFNDWSNKPIAHRVKLLKNLANLLEDNKQEYANLMTEEMGKPISQSIAEIEKCATLCDFYIANAENFLADQIIETEASESFISYDPLGAILAIMPWNYPFWQVFRFAVPTLTAGNVGLLKHASNVTGTALAIQKLFTDAGYPEGCFQTLIIQHDQMDSLLENDTIKAVTLTGSEKAGRSIAALAGKNLKKTVLELGGNNACIVLDDANLDKYIDTMVNARMQNNGQSCIAAKRFIVTKNIYDTFLTTFTNKVKDLKQANPKDYDAYSTSMAREDLAKELEEQVSKSLQLGAKVHYGNLRDKAKYQPTIITDVTTDMPIFKEETFGPVAAIIKAKDKTEALNLAKNSRFGLGTMIFTEDIDNIYQDISQIPDGALFINEMVKSDPRLPFGGTKASGYGRELSKEGILEFVNTKTVYINK